MDQKSKQSLINGINQMYKQQIGIRYFDHYEIAMHTIELYETGTMVIDDPERVINYFINELDIPNLVPDCKDLDIGENYLFYQADIKDVDKLIAIIHNHFFDGYNWPYYGFTVKNVQLKTKPINER